MWKSLEQFNLTLNTLIYLNAVRLLIIAWTGNIAERGLMTRDISTKVSKNVAYG